MRPFMVAGGYALRVRCKWSLALLPLLLLGCRDTSKKATDPTPDAGTWDALERAGITHIYVGARGEAAKRNALLASPRVRAIHRDGDAIVFAMRKSSGP